MKFHQSSNIRGAFKSLLRTDLAWLLFPGKHMALLSLRRAAMIISRVRTIAAFFALLSLLSVIPGLWLLPWPQSGQMAMGSFIAGLAFGALASSFQGVNRMRDAYLSLGILYAIPAVLFAYALLSQPDTNEPGFIIAEGYACIPLIMVAALGIFPLTAVEGGLYAVLMLAAQVVAGLLRVENVDPVPLIGSAWLLIAIAIVATLAAMGQMSSLLALMRTAIRDALTGCFSRMSGMELMDIQFIIATRSGAPLAVAHFDLDNIQGIRDAFGHDAADRVVVGAANAMRALLRTGDMLARWGGEAFVLIMPNTSREQAIAAIERILSSGLGVRPDNKAVTAGIGIAERIADDADDWNALVEIAEQRMREGRQSGDRSADFSGGAYRPAT